MKSWKYLAASLVLIGCGAPTANQSAQVAEPIDRMNLPEDIPGSGEYEYRPSKLPMQGAVTREVWTGSYWSLKDGGTAKVVSGSLSPMQKYDKAVNQGTKAQDWEMKSVRRHGHVSWAGHCNGLALAGIKTREPKRSVTYGGVTFSTEDIKALLVEAWQGAGSVVGRRCNIPNPKKDANGRMTDIECRDMNAGTFFVAVTNFIGLHKAPVIFDKAAHEEVWNYPAVSYKVTGKRNITEKEATKLLTGREGSYPYNSRATKFMKVQLRLDFIDGRKKTYDFIIEGNNSSRIIGGEWIGNSRTEHPDFIWRGERPRAENPHLDLSVIKEIYLKSIR